MIEGLRAPAGQHRAQRQAAHERREHRAHSGNGVADIESQQPCPDDFVDEGRAARAGEGDVQRDPQRHGRMMPRPATHADAGRRFR